MLLALIAFAAVVVLKVVGLVQVALWEGWIREKKVDAVREENAWRL